MYFKIKSMQTLHKTYKFRSRILSDGHLYVPEGIPATAGNEFEVTIAPVDDVKNAVSLYLDGRMEKSGKIAELSLDADKIEDAVKAAFGTADIDDIIQTVRR